MKQQKNKITTPGYFIKRLRDNGYGVIRIFQNYSKADSRRWTIMVDPSGASIFITCYENKDYLGDLVFEFADGGVLFPRAFSIKTQSIEVIISELVRRNVHQLSKDSEYYTDLPK